jgi:hypothetical protein
VLVIAGILIIGGAGAFAVSQISSDDTSGGGSSGTPASSSGGSSDNEQASDGDNQQQKPAIKPGDVTVAVLNGTTVTGLAQQVSERVAAKGFQVGTVANTADQQQQRAESVVLYSPGHREEAKAVSRRLGIPQRQPIDPGSQGLAGDATVVVIAGADLSQ